MGLIRSYKQSWEKLRRNPRGNPTISAHIILQTPLKFIITFISPILKTVVQKFAIRCKYHSRCKVSVRLLLERLVDSFLTIAVIGVEPGVLCLERDTNEAKVSVQSRIDPFASLVCQTADNCDKSFGPCTVDVRFPLMWYTWSLLGCNSWFSLSSSECLWCNGICGCVGLSIWSWMGTDSTAAGCEGGVGIWTSPGSMLNDNPASIGALGQSDTTFGGHAGLSMKIVSISYLCYSQQTKAI